MPQMNADTHNYRVVAAAFVLSAFVCVHLRLIIRIMTLFEKIIARQIPARIEFEDERYIVIHDIQPQAPVHVLVIPKKVIPTLNDVTDADRELIGGMFVAAARVMRSLGHSDYRTVFNCGAGAQQTVFHLHLHCLAGRALSWPPG
jgi:histidine triad (HIT) family protein